MSFIALLKEVFQCVAFENEEIVRSEGCARGCLYICENEGSSVLRCSEVAGLEEKAEATSGRQADQLSATDADRGLAQV